MTPKGTISPTPLEELANDEISVKVSDNNNEARYFALLRDYIALHKKSGYFVVRSSSNCARVMKDKIVLYTAPTSTASSTRNLLCSLAHLDWHFQSFADLLDGTGQIPQDFLNALPPITPKPICGPGQFITEK